MLTINDDEPTKLDEMKHANNLLMDVVDVFENGDCREDFMQYHPMRSWIDTIMVLVHHWLDANKWDTGVEEHGIGKMLFADSTDAYEVFKMDEEE